MDNKCLKPSREVVDTGKHMSASSKACKAIGNVKVHAMKMSFRIY